MYKRVLNYIKIKWSLAFTGSTLFEIEWYPGDPKKGGIYRIPGHTPSKEKYFLYRLWRTITT